MARPRKVSGPALVAVRATRDIVHVNHAFRMTRGQEASVTGDEAAALEALGHVEIIGVAEGGDDAEPKPE